MSSVPPPPPRETPSFTRPLREVATAAESASDALVRGARRLSRNLASLTTDEYARFLALAALIGLAAALAVTALYRAIDLIQHLTLDWAEAVPVGEALVIPLFVAGGLLASQALVHYVAHDSAGENVPDVMYRASLRGGVIPGRPVAAKLLAAAAMIGTGGHVGAEGPVIVGGAAVASRIGRWLNASPHRLRTLVGCGAAAGLSAAFNAPIAGVLFGIEKILGSTGGVSLGPFVVASIVAATTSRAIFGNQPVLALPLPYGLQSPWELGLYVLLGLLAGVAAVLYGRTVWRAHDWAAGRSRWAGIVIGALVIGGLDLIFRGDLWGRGHHAVSLAALVDRPILILAGLFVAKLMATSLTLAVGRTGGVFTPALFLGATLGTAVGQLATRLFGETLPVAPGAYGLAGMAAVVAGATHAPLTAIMMVFEMTGDYALILPIMLTSTLAYVVARRLHPESIYTEWLVRRGIVLTHGADAAVLARNAVLDCLRPAIETIPAGARLSDLVQMSQQRQQQAYPVLGPEGRLVGLLTADRVRTAATEAGGDGAEPTAADLMQPQPARVVPDDTLLTALRRMAAHELEVLPVVAPEDRDRLLGVVTRADLFRAYERALLLEQGQTP